MAVVPASMESTFLELGMDGSLESLGRLIDSQKKLFYSQVDHLRRVVDTHCKLTGVNPLSQEMAAGALSIKIGKKPRDLLNPKAVKYMQSVFSVKDIILKKETREISALCGVTGTQVRDFFAGQRSKVRKLVRLAREKAVRLDASESETANDRCSVNPDATPLCSNDALLSAGSIKNVGEPALVPASEGSSLPTQCEEKVHVSSVDGKPIQVPCLSSSHEESLPGIDEDDKKFLENIFNLMRKEGTFSGQVKLMEWILQIHNSALLVWFSTKGSIPILATWLSQAATEEQTTVLNCILKVLCHLPLHKSLPTEISSILPTVNTLRFYRTPDISNKAKILLSKWSKMMVRNQARKYPSFLNSKNGFQKEIVRKQRINEILNDDFWRSKIGNVEDILALKENSGNDSKPCFRHTSKLLTASCARSSRKQFQSASTKIKERRIVRLVEQLDEKPTVRNAQVGRAAPSNHSRPISADDIQKAKMRAMFMQDKYGKPDAPLPIENKKTEANKDFIIPDSNTLSPATEIVLPVNNVEDNKPEVLPLICETSINIMPAETLQIEPLVMLKSIQIQWVTPLEMKIDSSWRVGEAEGSKELAVQAQRIRREKETFYPSTSDIPPNPKEPWDVEMDYDDSLTPEIPIEQPPDTDVVEDCTDHHVDGTDCTGPVLPIASSCNVTVPTAAPFASSCNAAAPVAASGRPTASSGIGTEPDLELLAVLLKNPELVFALTSGQGKNLTNNERVALLDLIKHSNVVLNGAMNGMTGAAFEKPRESIPASLPSPTPPSDTERMGWRSAFPAMANAPLPQPQLSVASIHSFPTQIHSQPPAAALQSSNMPQLIIHANNIPQNAPISGFLSQRPNPSLPQHFLSQSYAVQQRSNAETLSNSAILAPSQTPAYFRQDSHSLNPPSFLPTHKNPQMLMMSEPSTAVFPLDPTPWTRPMPESSAQRSNAAEISLQNPWFSVNDNTHIDLYSRNRGRGEEVVGRSWSPESTPASSSDLRHGHGRSYADSRNEEWNQRQGWSRQRPVHRDQHRSSSGSGGQWRDRDRDWDRDRDRD